MSGNVSTIRTTWNKHHPWAVEVLRRNGRCDVGKVQLWREITPKHIIIRGSTGGTVVTLAKIKLVKEDVRKVQ